MHQRLSQKKESSYPKHWDANNPHGLAMSQKLSVKSFKWVEGLSEFDEDFIKRDNGKNKEGYFLEVDLHYPQNLHNAQNDLPFLYQKQILKMLKNCCLFTR